MDSVGAARFSSMFPTDPSDDLSHILILDALQNIDTSTMSNGALSEYIDWLNYNSPISPMNINQTLSSFATPQQYYPHPLYQYQYQYHPPQPLSYSAMSFATSYPRLQPSFSFMQPTLPVPQQVNNGYIFPSYYPMMPQYTYVPSPVGFVDDIFVIGTSSEYEEMLQLQEQIGHVNVGLSEKTITKNLKTSRISAANNVKQQEDDGEVCSVCQDEYKHNEMIGTLECGHKYHANCIKEWLLHKNVCPVCKATALVV